MRRRAIALAGSLAILATFALMQSTGVTGADARTDARILVDEPSTFDPAAQGDVSTAAITAQLYETLTTFDASLTLRPALAAGWDVSADGRQVVFHLRPDLAFSDGTPLTTDDVVGSWLRLIDPETPSPLAALLIDVVGARDHLAGASSEPAAVGMRASGSDVIVDLDRPGADFPATIAAPLFGVVPASVWRDGGADFGPGGATSGGYRVSAATASEITLVANSHYWAGTPALETIHLLLEIGGRSPVAAFEAGDVDYTDISSSDASWIAYDPDLGPRLREVPALAVNYLGFDTTATPFDDYRVRQAVGLAVDWQRVVSLGAFGSEAPADSIVPPGIPGGGDRSWLPEHDPDLARGLLMVAGYPGGRGLPPIHFAAGFGGHAEAIAAELVRELGMTVQIEAVADHFDRLRADAPEMWVAGWIADYPGANDFLGVILGTGASENYGRWSSPKFDQAIEDALATRDAAAAQAAFERALFEVKGEAPVVPLFYGTSWALSREGLLGAGQNGLGLMRMPGLAWAP
jgi:ABC-type oligopeptide transport system substrate-binding subunit